MRGQLLTRVDQLIESAASSRKMGKKQFLSACGVAPASYYRWRESMQRGSRWEIPGWLFELLMHSVGTDLSELFADLSALPWSLWPRRGKVTVVVGAEDSAPQPLSFRRIAERDARAAALLVDGLRRRTPDSWTVEFIAVSLSAGREAGTLRDRVRGILRDSACVAAIGSPAVNPVVDVLVGDYIFGGGTPPFRFRWPISIQGSYLSDPRADPEKVGIVRTETGERVVAADPLERIAAEGEEARSPFRCLDAAILAVDQRRPDLVDAGGERFELPIIILCMGLGAAGTEAAVRALFERSPAVDAFLRAATPEAPEGLLFEPIAVVCEKPAGTRHDDREIVSIAFAGEIGPMEKAPDRSTEPSR